MTSFVDNAGRTWTVALTVDSIKRVRALVGLNLLELEAGELSALQRLVTDIILLCDVVWAIVKPQADERGVTEEQLAAAMGGDAMSLAAQAFWQELEDFFRQRHRPDLLKAIGAMAKGVELAIRTAERRADELDIEAELRSILGDSSTSSPASPGSSPGR